jgi:hypothetical protein
LQSDKLKECVLNSLRFLRGYFVLIFHFKSLKISTFIRLLKPKLSTISLSRIAIYLIRIPYPQPELVTLGASR